MFDTAPTRPVGILKGMKMKKLFAITLLLASGVAMAHSGGTDSNGCHRETRTGSYHCH